jgi:hypothetical protein
MDPLGCGPHQGAGWTAVGYGVQVRDSAADDLGVVLQAWQLVLPYWSSFTGLTAARHRGWWVPPLPPGLPLFVAGMRSDAIRRPGLAVCRHDERPAAERVGGVRVTTAAETVLALARDLCLLDLVVVGDAALRSGDVTVGELVGAARQRRRGSPLLRKAIPLMDGRAESIYEGLLRMLHRSCGIAVVPQSTVVDESGSFVARADLRLVGTTRLAEYDGSDHLDRARQRRDLRRLARIEDAGHDRRGYTKEDVLLGGVGILRDADRALGRPFDPRRIDPWHALLRESLFSGQGQARLMARLGLSAENAEEIDE